MTRLRFSALAVQVAFGVLAVSASALAADEKDAYAFLIDRPQPKTTAEKNSECAWIRSEETRIQAQAEQGIATAAKYNSPALAESIKASANRNVAHLDDRYAQIQCVQVRTSAVPLSQTLFPQTLPPAQAPPVVVPPPAAPLAVSQAPAPPPPAAVPMGHAAIAPPQTAVPMSSVALPSAPAAAVPAVAGPAAAAPMAAPSAQPCGGLTFDQCFAKCRELTTRTAEQCFDACRH